MFPRLKVCILGLTWRASTVDSSIVVLTNGEVQGRTRFGKKFFPWFDRSFPYSAEWKHRTRQHTTRRDSKAHPATCGLERDSTNRSSILLESCVRISAARLWYSTWAWTRAASWLTCSICERRQGPETMTAVIYHSKVDTSSIISCLFLISDDFPQ